MKYVKVLEGITLTQLSGGAVVGQDGNPAILSFSDFVMTRLADPKLGKDMATILRVVEIRDKLKSMDNYLELEDADWRLLEDVTRNPSPQAAYNPAVAACLVPFMQAITEPLDKKPVAEACS